MLRAILNYLWPRAPRDEVAVTACMLRHPSGKTRLNEQFTAIVTNA